MNPMRFRTSIRSEFHVNCSVLIAEYNKKLAGTNIKMVEVAPYHEDWHRCFITQGENTSWGRITFNRGIRNFAGVYSVKSYCGWLRYYARFDALTVWASVNDVINGFLPDYSLYEFLFVDAWLFRNMRITEIYRNRSFLKDKPRKRVTGPSIFSIFFELLEYKRGEQVS